MIDSTEVFSSKAVKYAKYRWDYALEAIETIFEVTKISRHSVVADIGAGTGILTKHFFGKVSQIYAIEPNEEMRRMAKKTLASHSSCQIIDGRAEATTLADQCVDLITVAEAFNWFEPQATKTEFKRILKPGGWLAKLHNYGTNHRLDEAFEKIFPKECDTSSIMVGRGTPVHYYYGSEDYLKKTFSISQEETYEEFIGAISSTSYAPDENCPLYSNFEKAAREVFDNFSCNGILLVHGVTELCLGQIKE